MPTTADHTLFTATVEERRRLVTALEALSPTDWNQATLCEGWRVREVAAHLSMAYRYSRWGVVRGVLGAGGNFPRFADTAARHDVSMMADHELLQSLADNVESPWRPPGGGPAGALSHDVIHGLDITEPLGLAGPPVVTIRHVLEHAGPRNLRHFGVDLLGQRLEATDTEWHIGDGDSIRLSAKDILLVITGRKALAGAAAE